MKADSFDDLVATCVLSGFKHRMLYVFVQVGALPPEMVADAGDDAEEAGFVQILFDAHQPVQEGLSFGQLVQTADAHSPEWNLVVVGLSTNSDDTVPSEDEATRFLANMRERVLAGELDEFVVVDRQGSVVDLDTEEVDDSPHILN